MRLDTVELLMEIEEAFDIRIADGEAEQLSTVGETYHYILARLGSDEAAPGGPCLSAMAFYRFRRALIEVCGLERELIRPATPMGDLIAIRGRRAAWDQLASTLGWNLPALVHPAGVMRDSFILAAIAFVTIVIAALAAQTPPIVLLLILVLLPVALGVVVYRATLPFATRFPTRDSTLRGVLSDIAVRNAGRIHRDSGVAIPAGKIWETLIAVVAEQCGVPAETLREDTSFVYDLGMD
jgi:acyl carrier protein